MTIRTTDGQEHSVYLEYPKGDPREPMTEEDLDDKFAALTAPHLTDEGRSRIKETIFTCEILAGINQFMAVMVEGGK